MGYSSTGILAYGYHLGGGNHGWFLEEYEDYELKLPTWLDENEDLAEQIELRLLAEVVGFTETWRTRVDGAYHKREREAKEKLGIELVLYGTFDYPGYILATKVYNVGDYGAEEVTITLDHSAAHRLDVALKVLGMTPTQKEPKWILASLYG